MAFDCCPGCQEGYRERVKAYEELRILEPPSGADVECGIDPDPRIRNENILAAMNRGDPVILDLPELADIVHPSATPSSGSFRGHRGGRFIRASIKSRYPEFRLFAAQYGLELPHISTGRKGSAATIRRLYDRDKLRIDVLFFAFLYRYDAVKLSSAVNGLHPRTPKLVLVESRIASRLAA